MMDNVEALIKRIKTSNFERLVAHLMPLSICHRTVMSPLEFTMTILQKQWIVVNYDYVEYKDRCPCNHVIHERCWIYNIYTDKKTYVGNVCIQHFSYDEDVRRISHIATIIRGGVNVIRISHDPVRRCYRLRLCSRRCIIYKESERLNRYFGERPIDFKLEFDAFYDETYTGEHPKLHRSEQLVALSMQSRENAPKSGLVFRLRKVYSINDE